ncbi:MAG TPA: hypothetical protein VFM69_15775 [Pricia sp.]|nr:hypothetical protein [Pricia sp.]
MELIKTTGYNMPIHALPPKKWDEVICRGLVPRILMLLSVNLERNPERVAATELMIKESANRLSPEEIEKAFLMYVKGELAGLDPMDGHLTPIVFNKVVNQYKQQRTTKTELLEKPKITKQEKISNAQKSAMLAFDEYRETKKVKEAYSVLFDRLYDAGILPAKESDPRIEKRYDMLLTCAFGYVAAPIFDKLKWMEKEDLADTENYKKLVAEKHRIKDLRSAEIQSKFRCLVLEGYFKKIMAKENPREYFSMLTESDKFIDAI